MPGAPWSVRREPFPGQGVQEGAERERRLVGSPLAKWKKMRRHADGLASVGGKMESAGRRDQEDEWELWGMGN